MNNAFKRNIWKIYAFTFFISMHFIGGVLVPFFTDWGGISFAQIMLLQSWFLFWVFVLEIPTGALADRFGRKRPIALAAGINVIAALVYASTPNFYVFMLGEFLWALSGALISGADSAFAYDSLRKTSEQRKSKRVFGRMESFRLAGIMVGAPIGSIIAAQFGLNAPMLLVSIPFTVAFFIALSFREPEARHRGGHGDYLRVLKGGVAFFRSSRVLKVLAFDMVSIASVGYFMIWLYQPMLKQTGLGIAYFGLVHVALVAGQIWIINNYVMLERLLGSKKRLVTLGAVMTGAMFIIGGLSDFFPLVLLSIIVGGGFGLSRTPLFISYMNKHIPSAKRATVLSTVSMLRQFTLVVANPLVGMLVDWSLNYTLIILGAAAIAFAFVSKVEENHLID